MPSYVVKWLIMFNASIIYFVILFANQASYFSSYSYILPTLFPLFLVSSKNPVRFSFFSRWRRALG